MSEIRDFFPVLDVCGYVTGDVAVFATSIVPDGFLECTGTFHDMDIYAGLFAMIGYKYGQSGTDFAVPDYRGLFLTGDIGGVAGTYIPDMLKYHQHTMGIALTGPLTGAEDDNTLADSRIAQAVDTFGGSETRPKNINVMFCVKY